MIPDSEGVRFSNLALNIPKKQCINTSFLTFFLVRVLAQLLNQTLLILLLKIVILFKADSMLISKGTINCLLLRVIN